MSQLDIRHAKQALAFRLKSWGLTDPTRKATEFIDALVGQGWAISTNRETKRRPPKRDQECRTHPGQYADYCAPCATDKLAYDYDQETPTMRPAADHATPAAAIRERLREAGK